MPHSIPAINIIISLFLGINRSICVRCVSLALDRRAKFLAFLVRVGSSGRGRAESGRARRRRRAGASHWQTLRRITQSVISEHKQKTDRETELIVHISRHFPIKKNASESCDHDMSDPQEV